VNYRVNAVVMRVLLALVLAAGVSGSSGVAAQTRRGGRATTPATAMRSEPAMLQCPAPLGTGVQTKRMYCDVLTGRDLKEGIQVALPPHTGPVTLTFDLHNRHLYSEELIQSGRGYRHYTATIGVLTPNNDLLSRAVVQNEFRTAADLVERIGGDQGPAAVKAVAPTGTEQIRITIPANVPSVSILGEKLSVIRPDGDGTDSFSAPGRPVAVVSNVMIEYRPAPARRPATRR
jgi:hypothetical protein